MIFIIKSIETNEIHEAIRYERQQEGTEKVWAAAWPGEHTIGQDCLWVDISEKEWGRVKFIKENPDMTLKQLAKALCITKSWVYRLKDAHGLKVKPERSFWRKPKPVVKDCAPKTFNPNSRNNWMV